MLLNFSQLYGNDLIKKQLMHMVDQQAIGHALLFVGREGIGKSLFAQALIQLILSKEAQGARHLAKLASHAHPDVHHYYPEGKLGMHPIQILRQLSEEVQLPPYESQWKFFVIHEADRMLSYSANALLKTFEEPPPRTLIILLSASESALLPTILSRCRIVRFQPIEFSIVEEFLASRYPTIEASLRQQMARQAQGSLGRAMRLAEKKGDPYRALILNFLSHGPVGSYRTLQEVTHKLQSQVEEVKKEVEELAKKELYTLPSDQLSAHQQQALEKELEGWVTLAQMQETQGLLEHVLSWYRDLSYLLMGGKPAQLVNGDFYEKLEQAVQRGDYQPLEQAKQAVDEAYASLQRSTSLSLCLETLFLKLGRVI
jgi:DNA polymerase III subunit delta'